MEEQRFIDTSKQAFRIQVPWNLRFSLIWTLFFAIVGIFIQFSKNLEGFTWYNFFTSKYLEWFVNFGHFTNPIVYPDMQAVFFSILGSWYYFFYTGGLLALIWGILSWLIHAEFSVRKTNSQELPKETRASEIKIENSKQLFFHKIDKQEIQEWLDEAWVLISEGKVKEAEAIYNQIRRYYSPEKDSNKKLYSSIIDLYRALVECKR